MKELLDAMVRAALRAGEILREARKTGPAWVEEKEANDFVTAADKACEEAIRDTLLQVFPDIPLLAEEGSGTASGREGRFWCVDPLDGTNNFVRGVPVYCVSVGFIEDGEPALGVVFDPVHEELFKGGKGVRATKNGEPIRSSGGGRTHRSFPGHGVSFQRAVSP